MTTTNGRPVARSVPSRSTAARARLPGIFLGTVALVALVGCLPPTSRSPAGSNGAGASAGAGSGPPASDPRPTGPTPRPSFVPPTPTPAPTFLVHVVGSGENLTTIARLYGTTPRSIAFWNRATYPSLDPESAGYSPNVVKLGWTLVLIPRHSVDAEGELTASPEPSASPGPGASGG